MVEKKLDVTSKDFWLLWLTKIAETVISVKVLAITAGLVISTIMVYDGVMNGGTWGMFNGGVMSTVFALRTGFKISKVNGKNGAPAPDAYYKYDVNVSSDDADVPVKVETGLDV